MLHAAAKLRLQFSAISGHRNPAQVNIKDILWAEKSTKTRSTVQEAIEVQFGRDGKFRIPVAQCLKYLELETLASPEKPVVWKLQVKMGVLLRASFTIWSNDKKCRRRS